MRMRRFAAPCLALVLSGGLAALAGCRLPGRPTSGDVVLRPQAVMSFDKLYAKNCAGCHGVNGENGAATDLANPEYEALIDDATLRDVIANGEKGTLMPGFGTSSGGSLTDAQVNALVNGMRARWGRPNAFAGQTPPAYKAAQAGDAAPDLNHGQQVYAAACARCHGVTAQQPGPAGSILDGSFLALVNAQTIRNTVIAGRPDVGQPDWRGDVPGHPLTGADISDVTAWLLAQRPPNPGQPYPNANPVSERPGEAQPIAPAKR